MNKITMIGAGIAGLTSAKYLKDRGIEAFILEAADEDGEQRAWTTRRSITDCYGTFTFIGWKLAYLRGAGHRSMKWTREQRSDAVPNIFGKLNPLGNRYL